MSDVRTDDLLIRGAIGPLDASLATPATPHLRAVVGHPHPLYGGNKENPVVKTAQASLLARGAEVLRFNFRGVGQSSGTHDDGRGERDDLLAAYKRLGKGSDDDLPAWLAGYSFGAAMAMALLSEEEPRACPDRVLFIAPPLTVYDFSTVSRIEAPLAVVYGELDDFTPSARLAALTEWRGDRPTATFVVGGRGHDLGASGPATDLRSALDNAVDWLLEQPGGNNLLGKHS